MKVEIENLISVLKDSSLAPVFLHHNKKIVSELRDLLGKDEGKAFLEEAYVQNAALIDSLYEEIAQLKIKLDDKGTI